MNYLLEELAIIKQRVSSIRFKIERKEIKNEAKLEKKRSIHLLEIEKNLNFRPRRDRSKSIPYMSMKHRLKSLKEVKEDMQIQKCKLPEEFKSHDGMNPIRVQEFNYNDINREILVSP
jgi:hypothetical protein